MSKPKHNPFPSYYALQRQLSEANAKIEELIDNTRTESVLKAQQTATLAQQLTAAKGEVETLQWCAKAADNEKAERIAAQAAVWALAEQLYNSRRAVARLLNTYKTAFRGDWLELTAKDCGLEFDEIGWFKGPYLHHDASDERAQVEIEAIQIKALTHTPKATDE